MVTFILQSSYNRLIQNILYTKFTFQVLMVLVKIMCKFWQRTSIDTFISFIFNWSFSFIVMLQWCYSFLSSQTFSYFSVIAYIWLKGYQNGNHIKLSEQRLQEISIAKKLISRRIRTCGLWISGISNVASRCPALQIRC